MESVVGRAWAHDIPPLALGEGYEHLVHAMLAVAASQIGSKRREGIKSLLKKPRDRSHFGNIRDPRRHKEREELQSILRSRELSLPASFLSVDPPAAYMLLDIPIFDSLERIFSISVNIMAIAMG